MGLSRKLLFGLVSGVAATTAIVGTTVGLTTNTTSQSINPNGEENSDKNFNSNKSDTNNPNNNKSANTKPNDGILNDDSNVSSADINESRDENELDVKKIAETLNNDSVVIKTGSDGKEEKPIKESMLYAFNVTISQLGLKNEIKLPKDSEVKFEALNEKNTTTALNEGKFSIKITIKDKTKSDVVGSKELTLEGFKKASISEGTFMNVFETNDAKLVLNISPKKDDSKYVSLTFLNDQVSVDTNDAEVRSLHTEEALAPEAEEAPLKQMMESGLNSWIKMDETKKDKLSKATISGKVKLETISKNQQGNSTYFHLVSINQNQKLKLSIGEEEIVFDEIKTTNLLAEEVIVYPIGTVEEKNKEFIKALKETNQEGEGMVKYMDALDGLSVDLTASKTPKQASNLLLIKPYSLNLSSDNTMSLPIGIELKFGRNQYLTTFKTSEEEQIKILKEAGFNFGIFALKLTDINNNKVKASTFTDKKEHLIKYFTSTNYASPVARQEKDPKQSDTYPGGFSLKEIANSTLMKDLKIELGSETYTMPENYLFFADYSYLGNGDMKHLLTPVISLVHLSSEQKA